MHLTKHRTTRGSAWALDGHFLPRSFSFKKLMQLPQNELNDYLNSLSTTKAANNQLLPPIEDDQEVWACGVTYSRSRDAREAETEVKDVYEKVYHAERPELFFKAIGWRVVGHRSPIRIRRDSRWNVPEPELTLAINSRGEIIGYCVGNDVSSRDIEGENPLYLPQAKVYDGSCAIGPGIRIVDAERIKELDIGVEILRNNTRVFEGETNSSHMKRSLEELAFYLMKEMTFPYGAFLMTGTGIVPPNDFTLEVGDVVRIHIDSLILENEVQS
jgi:2-dehydro-3-deoxy-D-arabinonate dehydratase